MRISATMLAAAIGLGGPLAATAAAQDEQLSPAVRAVIKTLNDDDVVKGTEQSKSYRLLFDAYLKLTPPPLAVPDPLNINTVHPGMHDWPSISDWAESNPEMGQAILRCRDRNIIGLPYGVTEAEAKYRDAGLYVAIAFEGSLRRHEFPYLHAIDVIAVYATAEMYRLFEASKADAALDLAVSFNWVLRQMCDRQFVEEKLFAIQMLVDALANLRDAMYLYQDRISADQFRELSWYDLPALRPDRNRLHIPEADRILSEALLEEVFQGSQPDPEAFARAFAEIQAADEPLTRFGAAKRWRMIALVHGSLEASKERLTRIYDDWWRRWRVQQHDPILDLKTEFERTNPVRYAAVIYSMSDLQDVFTVRNQLIASVNGTAVAAGLCGYRQTYGVYPDDKEKTYGQFVRKLICDIDPFDESFGRLGYRFLDRAEQIETPLGRIQIAADEAILYSQGADQTDDRGRQHTDTGLDGDFVIWPPLKVLAREQGLLQ